MISRTLLAGFGVAFAACAHSAPLQEIVTPQSRLGLAEGFGPGIVAATSKSMSLQLDAPGHVMVLRVLDNGDIDQVHPVGDGTDPALPQGHYSFGIAPRRPYAPSPGYVPSGPTYGSCYSFESDNDVKVNPACWTIERVVTAGPTPTAPMRPREREAGYWLVIVSDAATPPGALNARLRALELDGGSLSEDVLQIPSALIAGRTTNWSAFSVGFAVVPVVTKH